MIHWSWIIAGFVFGAWYGMLLVLLTTTRKQKRGNKILRSDSAGGEKGRTGR